jgi:hypothetical protein
MVNGGNTELPIGEQAKETPDQVADEFAALAVKIVMKENPEAPVLSELAGTKLIASQPR